MNEQLIAAQALAEPVIKKFEGLRLTAYRDAIGIPTIGYGLTRIDGKPVKMGMKISVDEADDLLQVEILRVAEKVEKLVEVRVTTAMLAALISFAFNVGVAALRASTLLRRLNAGDYVLAADQILRWNKATDPKAGQMRALAGLTQRRNAERAMFLSEGTPS